MKGLTDCSTDFCNYFSATNPGAVVLTFKEVSSWNTQIVAKNALISAVWFEQSLFSLSKHFSTWESLKIAVITSSLNALSCNISVRWQSEPTTFASTSLNLSLDIIFSRSKCWLWTLKTILTGTKWIILDSGYGLVAEVTDWGRKEGVDFAIILFKEIHDVGGVVPLAIKHCRKNKP